MTVSPVATSDNASPTPPRIAYTPREVSARLGRPYRFVLDLIASGKLRSRRDGHRYVVPVDALDEYLSATS